jgi:hypothetical protein
MSFGLLDFFSSLGGKVIVKSWLDTQSKQIRLSEQLQEQWFSRDLSQYGTLPFKGEPERFS